MKYVVMKRGRPNIRYKIQQEITTILSRFSTPVAISTIKKEVSQSVNREISWNTVQKYVQELVDSGRLQAIQLSHSKVENKEGLVLYTLKK